MIKGDKCNYIFSYIPYYFTANDTKKDAEHQLQPLIARQFCVWHFKAFRFHFFLFPFFFRFFWQDFHHIIFKIDTFNHQSRTFELQFWWILQQKRISSFKKDKIQWVYVVRVACNCVNGLTRTNGYSNNRQWHTLFLFVTFISMLEALRCFFFSQLFVILFRDLFKYSDAELLLRISICSIVFVFHFVHKIVWYPFGNIGPFTSYAICLMK